MGAHARREGTDPGGDGAAGLAGSVDTIRHPLDDPAFRARCRDELEAHGALVLPGFLTAGALARVRAEADARRHLAHFTSGEHNAYLAPSDPAFADDHPRNRRVASSKGCITTDQVPADSALRALHASDAFRAFLCDVLGERELHGYADPLSSINVHYAGAGQELGWHYDESAFAVTLLITKPVGGGVFEWVRDARDADAGDMGYARTRRVLDGGETPASLPIDEGALVLFRGRNSLHWVTPTVGDVTRTLVVLAYNAEPGVSLSEAARMTFFGRLG